MTPREDSGCLRCVRGACRRFQGGAVVAGTHVDGDCAACALPSRAAGSCRIISIRCTVVSDKFCEFCKILQNFAKFFTKCAKVVHNEFSSFLITRSSMILHRNFEQILLAHRLGVYNTYIPKRCGCKILRLTSEKWEFCKILNVLQNFANFCFF